MVTSVIAPYRIHHGGDSSSPSGRRGRHRVHAARVRARPRRSVLRQRGRGEARRRAGAALQDARRLGGRRARGRARPGAEPTRPEGARQARAARRQRARAAHDRLRQRRNEPAGPAQATADAHGRLGARSCDDPRQRRPPRFADGARPARPRTADRREGAPDSVRRMTAAPVELHVVSDATGETAARLVQALEAQFPDQGFVEIRHPRVESADDLQLAVNRMRGRPAVVIYTIVQPELREAMRALCRRAKLHYCDLLGHPIEAVARVSGMAARMTPGSRPPLNSAYFKRMEAIEFAVRFDDGVGRGLHDADLVLVGVSRTSKTPLSIYLGYLGHKAANVPVVKGIEPPKELFEIDPRKIVGLTIDPNRLVEIRRARVRTMGARNRQYAELMEIYEELEVATKLHRRLGCPVIDISELSIEETAHRVLRVVEERKTAA